MDEPTPNSLTADIASYSSWEEMMMDEFGFNFSGQNFSNDDQDSLSIALEEDWLLNSLHINQSTPPVDNGFPVLFSADVPSNTSRDTTSETTMMTNSSGNCFVFENVDEQQKLDAIIVEPDSNQKNIIKSTKRSRDGDDNSYQDESKRLKVNLPSDESSSALVGTELSSLIHTNTMYCPVHHGTRMYDYCPEEFTSDPYYMGELLKSQMPLCSICKSKPGRTLINATSSKLKMPLVDNKSPMIPSASTSMIAENQIPEDGINNERGRLRRGRDVNQNVIDRMAKQLNFKANVAQMAKEYLDTVCASSTSQQLRRMTLDVIAGVCFYIACNEKEGDDPRSIEEIRVICNIRQLSHNGQKSYYTRCYDHVCKLLGKSVNVLESTIKRFARKMRLSNTATCESASLVCNRAYKVLPFEMQFKEINTVAATALYNVANICNLTEYSKRIGVSSNAIRLLNNLWLTKSDEILMDQVKDSHRSTAKVLKIAIKESISTNDA
jgi:hypothetical protein